MASATALVADACALAAASQPADAGLTVSQLQELCALELPDDVQFQLSQFKKLLSDLQAALQAAVVQVPGPAELAKLSEPLERARLCMVVAKAVNSLHHAYLRAHGRDPFAPSTAGGVAVGRQELDRVRQYDKKVNRAVNEAELRSSRPSMTLDVAAASRFIDAAIPDLTEQQRKDLKRAAQAVEARRGDGQQQQQRGKKARPGVGASQQQQQQQQRKQPTAAVAAAAAKEEEEEEADQEDVEGEDDTGPGELGNGARSKVAGPSAASAPPTRPAGARAAAEQFLAAFSAASGPPAE